MLTRGKGVFGSVLLVLLLSNFAHAATYVSGPISENTAWPLANSPYVVTGYVQVWATLTIEPGVVVKFDQDAVLYIQGTLSAVGTPGNTIHFTDLRDDNVAGDTNGDGEATSPAPGWWNSIYVADGAAAMLDNTSVRYAGGIWGNSVQKAGASSLSLTHSTISDSAGNGVGIVSSASDHTISNNMIENNGSDGISLVSTGSAVTISGNTITGNAGWGIGRHSPIGLPVLSGNTITGNTRGPLSLDGSISVDMTLTLANSPYVVTGRLQVGATLTIEPGVVVKFDQNADLYIQGTLSAVGTPGNTIHFTDLRDDSVAGDTNGDGAATSPAAGWWNGIFVYGGGATTLDCTSVRYAGAGTNSSVHVYSGTGSLSLTHSTISDGAGNGVGIVWSASDHTISDNLIENNAGAGISLYGSTGVITVSGNTIRNNGSDGISLSGTGSTVAISGNTITGNTGWGIWHYSPLGLPVLSGNTITGNTRGPQALGGGISADMTLTLSDSPYVVVGGLQVFPGVTLTIEPGVVVKFDQNTTLDMQGGNLNATGTSGNTIHFTDLRDDSVGGDTNGDGAATSPAAGWWYGIHFRDGSAATLDYTSVRYTEGVYGFTSSVFKAGAGSLRLTHSTISNGAHNGVSIEGSASDHTISNNLVENNAGAGILLNSDTGVVTINGNTIRNNGGDGIGPNLYGSTGSPVAISNNTIENNVGAGISLNNATGVITISGNTIRNNRNDGISLFNTGSTVAISGNTITGNAGWGIGRHSPVGLPVLSGNTITGNTRGPLGFDGGISVDMTLTLANSPYVVTGGLQVGATLTIEPGVVVKFDQSAGLDIQGTLNAVGTFGSIIHFTDLRDDSVGGDTNGDGAATSPAAGDWWEIYVGNGGTATLDYTSVRYAGGRYGSSVYKTGPGSLSLTHSTISNGARNGVGILYSASDYTISNNLIENNAGAGIFSNGDMSAITISGNTIRNNGSDGISYVYTGSTGEISGNLIESNVGAGILLYGSAGEITISGNTIRDHALCGLRLFESRSELHLADNTIAGNPGYGLCNAGSGLVDAANTNWGSPTGPLDDSDDRVTGGLYNPGGLGDRVSDQVLYYPWIGMAEIGLTAVPTGLSAATGNGSVGLVWNANTEPYLGGYKIYYGTAPGVYAIPKVTGATPSYQLAGLTSGRMYYIAVSSMNTVGFESAKSAEVSIVPTCESCPTVATGAASDVTTVSATLGATVQTRGCAEAAVWFEYGIEGEGLLNGTGGPTVGPEGSTIQTTQPIADLLCGSTYRFRAATRCPSIEWNPSYGFERTFVTSSCEFDEGPAIPPAAGPITPSTGLNSRYSSALRIHSSKGRIVAIDNGSQSLRMRYERVYECCGWCIAGGDYDRRTGIAVYLDGAEPGLYDVTISNCSGTTRYPGAFEVLETSFGIFRLTMSGPPATRPNRPYALTTRYSSVWSGSPREAPVLLVSNDVGAEMAFSSSEQFEAGPRQFLGINQAGVPGLLPEGQDFSLPVYFRSTTQSATFTLRWLYPTTRLNWDEIFGDNPPAGIERAPWEIVKLHLRVRLTESAGFYAMVLRDNSMYLHEHRASLRYALAGDQMVPIKETDPTLYDVDGLLALEYARASGALHPRSSLDASQDLWVPAPGLPLSFGRFAPVSIPGRFAKGPLGRGWVHSWEYSAATDAAGKVTITGPGGSGRVFKLRLDGSYQGVPGDTGLVTVSGATSTIREKDGVVWQYAGGKLASIADPNGNALAFSYAGALLSAVTHSNGQAITLSYDGAGRITEARDPAGRIVSYTYGGPDGDHLMQVQQPGGFVTEYSYLPADGSASARAMSSITHPDGTHTFYEYDPSWGFLTMESKDGGAESIHYAYVGPGTVSVTDALGRTTLVHFGVRGEVLGIEDPLGRSSSMAFDTRGLTSQFIGPDGKKTSVAYDGVGNPVGMMNPAGRMVTMEYDPVFNRLAGLVDQKANRTTFDYDGTGNLRAITYPDASVESFTADASGNLEERTNRRGGSIHYEHNERGQVTSKTHPDGRTFIYTYDDRGNMTSATDSLTGAIAMVYDARDMLTRIEYPGDKWFSFEYDSAGRRTRRVGHDGDVLAYHYDTLGRLHALLDGTGAEIVRYSYDFVGRLAREDKGNTTATTYEYDAAGQLLKMTNLAPGGAVQSSFQYTYDVRGNRISMTTLEGTTSYTYDSLGQLTSVTLPGGREVNYAYDASGNRTVVTDSGAATGYTTNAMNQYTQVGDATYTYDTEGNLLIKTVAGGSTTYAYDAENRLVRVVTPSDGTWEYTYDALGNRVEVRHGGAASRYVHDPVGLVDVALEYNGSGSLVARYTHGLGLVARSEAAGAHAWYAFDGIGHTRQMSSEIGVVANSYDYLPFGESLRAEETIPNPFRYVGFYGVLDDGNGLNYMRGRYSLNA